MKIYVGMALSGAPAEFREVFQYELKTALRALPETEVLDFFWTTHGPEAGDDTAVFLQDKSHTESADLCIFILDYPSLGLGMEMMIRSQVGKPSLFFVTANPQNRISRMVLGYIKHTNQTVSTYTTVADIVSEVKQYVSENPTNPR